MASRRKVGGVEVELSNLDKVLYPATGTTKGEVIAYYSAISAAMLPHIAGRPVTRKRWPNGVDSSAFFEKNLAAHAPSWLERNTVAHSSRKADYPVIDTEAGLVWLGQQAALEIHVPQWRFEHGRIGSATRLVFDLDPGPGAGLVECATVALAVRDMVARIGLSAFPVTSGSKGMHLYVPLEQQLSPGGASTVAKQVATNLERLHPDLVTATMAKSARAGKIFLDWSQNNPSKTTIAPYSLRGRAEPTVAAPRTWTEIESPDSLRHLRFDEVITRFQDDGDLLAGLDPPLGASGTAGPDPLTKYRSMRDGTRTPEPVPTQRPVSTANNRYVVHEHHARRLHWDVRLERDGVLVCWAVPKGPPTSTRGNRLAVHTEDHPLEYIDFHGVIPKGQYGAGAMTVWDSGSYDTEKWRDDEVIVVFHGSRLTGRYALIRTEGDQWLMHLMREQPTDASRRGLPHAEPEPEPDTAYSGSKSPFPQGLSPMLATQGEVAELAPGDWAFETKWDGFRLLVEVAGGAVTLRSRAGNVVTERYPSIVAAAGELARHELVLDGEAVVFGADEVPDFPLLQSNPERATFVAFDVLYVDGTSLVRKKYADRRQVLAALAQRAPGLFVPPQLTGSGAEALDYSRARGWEGVVAKRMDSVYLPGKRGHSWVKQRNWRAQEVLIGGWRRSNARPFKSLLVGVRRDAELIYVGRVGTGFDETGMRELAARLNPLVRKTSPFDNELTRDERAEAVWVTPKVVGTVRYMSWTETGRLWHPIWAGS